MFENNAELNAKLITAELIKLTNNKKFIYKYTDGRHTIQTPRTGQKITVPTIDSDTEASAREILKTLIKTRRE